MRNIFPARNIENSKGFSKNQIGIKFLLGENDFLQEFVSDTDKLSLTR